MPKHYALAFAKSLGDERLDKTNLMNLVTVIKTLDLELLNHSEIGIISVREMPFCDNKLERPVFRRTIENCFVYSELVDYIGKYGNERTALMLVFEGDKKAVEGLVIENKELLEKGDFVRVNRINRRAEQCKRLAMRYGSVRHYLDAS